MSTIPNHTKPNISHFLTDLAFLLNYSKKLCVCVFMITPKTPKKYVTLENQITGTTNTKMTGSYIICQYLIKLYYYIKYLPTVIPLTQELKIND